MFEILEIAARQINTNRPVDTLSMDVHSLTGGQTDRFC